MAENVVKVRLGIDADITAAKKAISSLEASLTNLRKAQASRGFEDFGLNEAVQNAKVLESSLNRAFNQNTNKLDLSVLNKNLREAGTSVNEISAQFLRAGTAGQQAFMSLATAVAHTEVPLKTANRLVQSFARTLKNTAQYQISATMYQGVTKAISDAISYTKNLNSSLNDIRIVTGQSAAEMAKFAQAANASAQKLSTTTNSYAKASLIFYQQGLSDAEVKKRTDAVIKMANVTKENMEDVSSYMTAVWNNFDDGSKSLEHYADVMTALGAATASSTKEIAAGLEKFASIGKTIGLSYDYATSALATIVSKTRQSADTVGTGLRTIFSRLQGLSLGETLEDGVDLNKYSSALKTVGVNILDATGNMRDMDAILESLAGKWENLSSAQKTALAQTVGGVRQYTTLISLMDNWDSMKQNLNTAKGADGSLQRQQDIYAESWEAAANRSKAAVEELFSTLLNDKGFIKMTNGITAVTKAVTALANGFGGLPGILSTVGMIATKVFSQQITSGISDSLLKLNTWAGQFQGNSFLGKVGAGAKGILTGKTKSYAQVNAEKEMANTQAGYEKTKSQLEASGKKDSAEYYSVEAASQLLAAKQKLIATEGSLTAAQKARAQADITAMAEEQAMVLALRQEKEALAKAEKQSSTADIKNVVRAGSAQKGTRKDGTTFVRSNDAAANWILSRAAGYNASNGTQGLVDLRQKQSNAAYQTTMANKYSGALKQMSPDDVSGRTQLMASINKTFGEGTVTKIEDIEKALQKIVNAANAAEKEIQDVIDGAKGADLEAGNALEDYVGAGRTHGEAQGMIDWEEAVRTNQIPTQATTVQEQEAQRRAMEKMREEKAAKIAGGMQKASQAVMSFTAGLSQATTLMETLGDESASTAEKITSSMSVASSALSAFATGGILGGVAYLAGFALTAGLDAIDKAYRAEEIAADQAQADAEALKQNYETIKESYDNLLSTFDSYKEGSNTLDSLIVGTDEWKEALIEANEAALQLINSLGLMEGQDYTVGTNGEITFTKEGQNRIDQAQSDKLQETLTAQSAANLAQAEAASARAKADLDTTTKSNDKGRWATALTLAGTGALYGGAIGSAASPLGTAIGAIIGGVGGLLGGLWGYDQSQETVNKVERDKVDSIVKKYEDRNGTMTDSELKDLIDKQFAGESESYKKSILKVVKSTVEANKQLNDAMKLAAQNVLNSNEIYNSMTNSDAQEDVSARASKIYKDAAEAAGTKFDSTTDADTRKQWAQEYAASLTAGKQGVDISYNDDGSFTYSYIGDDGHVTEDFKVTETMLRTWYKSSQGDAAVNAEVEALSQVYTDLREGKVEGISKSSQAAIASMSSRGNLNDMTGDEINGFSDADLEALTQDQLTALGFVDLADAKAKREEMRAAYVKEWNALAAEHKGDGGFYHEYGDHEGLDWSRDMSLNAFKNFDNTLNELENGPIAEIGKKLNLGIEKAFEEANVSEEDRIALLDQISQIDWSDYDAFEQFEAIFEGMGYSIDTASGEWDEFITTMRQASGAIPDFTKLKDNLSAMARITKDLKLGDIVSEEDYDTLVKINEAYADLFTLQADGSRKFIGDAEAMRAATKQMALDQKELLDSYKKVADIEAVAKFNWDDADREGAAQAFEDLYDDEKNEALRTMLADAGYTGDIIDEIITEAANGDISRLEALFDLVQKATDPAQMAVATQELEEMVASTATTVGELQAMLADNTISEETYSKSLVALASGYEYCAEAVKAYQEALASGEGVEEAEAALERVVELEREAAKYEGVFEKAISNRASMTAEDLTILKEIDPNLYTEYLSMSDEEWYEASYQAYSKWLDARIAGYPEDSAAFKALMMEKRQAEDEYYAQAREKAITAKEAQDEIWDNKKSGASDALSTIKSNLESADTLSFENIADLETSLYKAGVSAERIRAILQNLNDDDSADAIRKKTAAAMEAAFAGMAADNEKAKEYNSLLSIDAINIAQSVYDEIDSLTEGKTFDLTPEVKDEEAISKIKILQEPSTKTITILGEEGESYTTTYVNCTADGATRTITFLGTDGEQYSAEFLACTADGATRTITFIGTEGQTYTTTYQSCTADGATKTITFIGAEGQAYTDTYTSCTADGATKTITFNGANGNYTEQYTSIVGGASGSKTISLMLAGGAEGQQSALQLEVDKISLDGKTIKYEGDFGQIEETLAKYGLSSNDSGGVTMDIEGESGYTDSAAVNGIQLNAGQLTFSTNLGTIQGEVDNLTTDLAALPNDYPITVTLSDGTESTITAEELRGFTSETGVNMTAVVNYLEGKNADLTKDTEITVTVNYEENLKKNREQALREKYADTASAQFIRDFDSGNVEEMMQQATGTYNTSHETGALWWKSTETVTHDKTKEWLNGANAQRRAEMGLAIDAIGQMDFQTDADIAQIQAIQAFIEQLKQHDAELAAEYEILFYGALEANESVTKNADGVYELASASAPLPDVPPSEKVVETVTDQEVFNGAADATYTQAQTAFQAYDWKQIGTDIVAGVTAGINEGLANFDTGNWDPAAAATEAAARGSYQTQSPSRLMIPIGHDVVDGVEVGIRDGLAGADPGDWTSYAAATLAAAEGAFSEIKSGGIGDLVKASMLTDFAEFDTSPTSAMVRGEDGLWHYDNSVMGRTLSNAEGGTDALAWYNNYGQYLSQTNGVYDLNNPSQAWLAAKGYDPNNITDEIMAEWQEGMANMPRFDQDAVMNDYMHTYWETIANEDVNAIEGMSDYQRGILADVYDRVIKELGKDATGAEITARMQEIIDNEGILLNASAAKAWGQIKDIMVEGVAGVVASEQTAAQLTYDIWVSTFKAISSARLALMDEESASLLSQMQNDAEGLKNTYLALINDPANAGATTEQIMGWMTATGEDKRDAMSHFNYNPFDLNSYKASGAQAYLDWSGAATNGAYGLQTTTTEEFMSNINRDLLPQLLEEPGRIIDEYLTPEKLATMSQAEGDVLVAKGLLTRDEKGVYHRTDADASQFTSDPEFMGALLASILGIDSSLLTYVEGEGFGVAEGKEDKAQAAVNDIWADAMAETTSRNQQMASQITAENLQVMSKKQEELSVLEKARDSGVESLTVAEQEQLRSILGLGEGADLSAVSLDTLTGAAEAAAQALMQMANQAQTDEYMALQGYKRNADGSYSLSYDDATMTGMGYSKDANGNWVRGEGDAQETLMATVSGADAYARASGYETGNEVIDDAADGTTGKQVAADNRLALAQEAGFESIEDQNDFIHNAENRTIVGVNGESKNLMATQTEIRDSMIEGQLSDQDIAGWDSLDESWQSLVSQSLGEGKSADQIEQILAATDGYDKLSEAQKEALKTASKLNLSDEERAELLKEAEKIQQKYANQLKKMEKAYDRLAKEGRDLLKTANDEEASMSERADAVDGLREIYTDILGPMDKVGDAFVKNADNMKLAEEAAAGNEESLNKLQVAYLEALAGVDFQGPLQDLAAEVAAWDPGDLEVGATIDDTDFLAKCAELVNKAGLTADQASDALSAMGVDAEIEEHEVPIGEDGTTTIQAQGTIYVPKVDENGNVSYEAVDATGGYTIEGESGQTVKYYTIKGAKYNGKGVTGGGGGGTGGGGRRGGGGGGGGGGRRDPRRANHVKKEDYAERYHEIDNVIDDLADAYERLNKEEDRAWGKNRIDAMKEQTKVIKDQIAATEEKIRQAKEYLEGYYDTNGKWVKGDRQAAEDMGWEFDADGNVSNYDEFMEDQVNKYNAAIDAYNGMSAEAQEELDKKYQDMKNEDGEYYSGYEDYLKQTLLDDPKEALEQYEETMELLEDLGMDYDDLLNEWHDNIIGQIQTKLDTTLEVTEAQLGYLEHKLSRIEDDAYSAAEAIGLMGQQMDIAQTQFNAHKSALDDLLKAYSPEGTVWSAEDLMNGNISSEDLVNAGMQSGDIELIQTIMEGMMDASEQMSEQMVNSIEHMANAFEEFNADMDRYISTVEHAQAITSTYRNIIDLTGRTMSGFNSTMLKSINDAIAAQSIAKLEANKTKYETVKTEYDEAKAAYEAAQASYAEGGIDAAALKAAKDTYQTAQDNMNEAQEAFLSSWEEALQAAADAFQSNMEAAVRDIGEMMSGGLAGGLAELEDAFAKMNERDQNYVDDYEKIYQLTKMTRDLTDKIDSTSNIRAQKELLKYQKELNGLLESDQEMSAYDLDYLQKKLDLKLAEIALDEAQNAKSQVTMRRDSEGNYNYVYTADENAVEKAESDYADRLYEMQKANDEYITGLSENMANLSSQMLSEIAAIDTTIYDTEEKYQAEVQRITDHYTSQMEYYNSEMNKVLGNNKTLYEQDWTNFSKYTGYKLSAEENYVTKWNQTVLSQVTGFETQEEFYQNFNEAVFGGDPAHPSGESLIGRLVTAYKTMREQIAAANAAAGVETEDLATALLGNIEAATQEAEAAADDITEAATEIVTQITSIGDAVTNMVNNYSQAMATMEAETDAMLGVLLDFLTAYGEIGDLDIEPSVLAEIEERRRARQENPEGYDTGGYTGAWGSEGRLAYLHQKELVLNAEDTANMLASVGILRQIANVIDLNALASAGGFISLMSSGVAGNQGTLQQEVHIEASFPAVTDKNQIEEAFGDLVNLAAQYANRKL